MANEFPGLLKPFLTQLTAPEFNMSVSIKQGENWMGPMTPKKDFVLACSMGMYRADVHVKQG
jgi:hypothetical protein